jgi:hypothetical protein
MTPLQLDDGFADDAAGPLAAMGAASIEVSGWVAGARCAAGVELGGEISM